MAKVTPISEYFQPFLADLKETFWGDVYGQTRLAWQRFFQLESERQRDRFAGWGWYERGARKRRQYRNGYYERDFVTRFGTPYRAHPGEEFSAVRTAAFSAVRGRGFDVNPRGLSARHQHAAGGASGGRAERRRGECADGLETDARSGSGGG